MASLSFISEPRTGERVSLEKPKTIFGRHRSCDCQLTGKTVSREHFSIENSYGKFFLVDLGSANGTFANDERVSWVELKPGDKIRVGTYVLVFADDEADQTAGEDLSSQPKDSAYLTSHEQLYPRPYLEGIDHFNARSYFDAHEVWEEIWLYATDEAKLFYQMLIQAAVALHHYERGNSRGARGVYRNVVEKLERLPSVFMSLDLADFAHQFKDFFAELIENNNEAPPPAARKRPFITLHETDADTGEHRMRVE